MAGGSGKTLGSPRIPFDEEDESPFVGLLHIEPWRVPARPARRHGNRPAARITTGHPLRLAAPRIDAILGPALDGGYWSVGLAHPHRDVFTGVPMSTPSTLRAQRVRLLDLGLTVHEQRPLRDVDAIEDARAVAREAPHSRFASALASIA